ncbi:jg8873 [Pararge aegeria aegeria]|uniref:Jg8873 protein n=1 Tax=Pararge aegeria aegeria TaxID=348720 RepID=A0A8S4R3F9_9NEOP|nr:jg8873 [Pararge aegeria aegeria]
MRRPIFVYGVDIVNSFRGEALGYARFQDISLPNTNIKFVAASRPEARFRRDFTQPRSSPPTLTRTTSNTHTTHITRNIKTLAHLQHATRYAC